MKIFQTSHATMLVPDTEETEQSKEASKFLSAFKKNYPNKVTLSFHSEKKNREDIEISTALYEIFVEVLSQISHGNPITLIPKDSEFSTQEAAEFLNVSRPFIVKVIEKGEIPSRKVGTHRRIRFSDIMKYKLQHDYKSEKALQELAEQAQELNLGYGKEK